MSISGSTIIHLYDEVLVEVPAQFIPFFPEGPHVILIFLEMSGKCLQ